MNKRTGWENEATTRAINSEPWEPMPGMVKRQCPECRYRFAAPVDRPLSRAARTAWKSCRPAGGDQGEKLVNGKTAKRPHNYAGRRRTS